MAGTIRPDTITVSTSTPILANKPLPVPAISTKLSSKPTITAPRVDVEPLYTTLKSQIGDGHWALYKGTISAFLLGKLNQEELSSTLSPILTTRELEHTHNTLLFAIYANIFRDAPDPGIASFVSANDKVSTLAKPNTGDEAEKRLKHEVMQLNGRERKRLKGIQNETFDAFAEEMREWQLSRSVLVPDTGPASAGGFQKTNWDLEIRKHYTQPLFTETHEFPDTDSITARMTPICYENGLPSGHSSECPSFMNIATETFVKELLSNFLSRIASNGEKYVKTGKYKKQVEKEERRVARGEMQRQPGGLLPIEAEEARKRRPLNMEDVRLVLELGDSFLGQAPLIAGGITMSRFLDADGAEDLENAGSKGISSVVNGISVNGAGAARAETNGWSVNLGDPMEIDEDIAWQGGSVQDVDGLDDLLDNCLAIGA